jgi:hypothetical protein
MEKVIGPKNDPLRGKPGVKGQYDQKYIMVVKHLVVGKLMSPVIRLPRNNLILTSLWGSYWGSKLMKIAF